MSIDIYTDGACLGNPGPGGYAAVIINGDSRIEIADGYRQTTNNRMEMMAVYAALTAIGNIREEINIYSDSRLFVDAINKGWLNGWKRRNWKKADGSSVLNPDIWQYIDSIMSNFSCSVHWVKGHADNPENNRCDELARLAASSKPQKVDHGYEGAPQKEMFNLDIDEITVIHGKKEEDEVESKEKERRKPRRVKFKLTEDKKVELEIKTKEITVNVSLSQEEKEDLIELLSEL